MLKKLNDIFIFILLFLLILVFPPSVLANDSFINLGPQVTNVNAIKSVAGVNENGDPLMFTVLQGVPAALAVTNLKTGELIDEQSLPNTTAAWSLYLEDDHTLWVGSTPNELLYSYDINEKKLINRGKASTPSSTSIWDLTFNPNDQSIYGSSSYEGKVFRYHNNRFEDLGTILPGKNEARSVEYSTDNNTLYIGVGSPAELVAFDLTTKTKTSILPTQYQNETFIRSLQVVDGLLFARLNPSNKFIYFDISTNQFLGEFDASSLVVSDKSPIDDIIYFGNTNRGLSTFDLKTHQIANAERSGVVTASITSFDFLKLENNQYSLVAKVANDTRYLTYNIETKRQQNSHLNLPPQPIEIHRIGSGPDGKIYSSGFLNGSLGIYSPFDNSTMIRPPIGQIESMANLNGELYLGTYPNANILKYNPNHLWTSANPLQLFSLGTSHEQNRPMTMIGIDSHNVLAFGTVPIQGRDSGVLGFYQPGKSPQIRRHIVPRQSIVGLAFDNRSNLLYVGTSIYGTAQTNIDRNRDVAKLFTIPIDNINAQPTYINLPFPQTRHISSLLVAESGLVWGSADMHVFAYDPSSKKIVFSNKVVNDVTGFLPTSSLVENNGYIYGAVGGTFFSINQNNFHIDKLRTGVEQVIVHNSNVYFHDKTHLWLYTGNIKQVNSLIHEAERHAGALKWAISFEGSADGRTRPSAIYANTRNAYLAAQAAINTLDVNIQDELRSRLEANVGIYVERAMRYNDAVVAGNKLEESRVAFEIQLKRSVIDQNFVNSYNKLNQELRKAQRIIGLVYGKSTRAKFREMYENSASVILTKGTYSVASYNEIKKLESFIQANDTKNIENSSTTITNLLSNINNITHKSYLQKEFHILLGIEDVPFNQEYYNTAITLIEQAEKYAGALKWAISFEGSADGRTRPGAIYANTRNTMLAAAEAINKLPLSIKEELTQRLEVNVGIYVDRAMRYNDAVTAGNKLDERRITFQSQLNRTVVDQTFVNAYNLLNQEVRKQQRILSLVYGKSTRNTLRQMYEHSALSVLDQGSFAVATYNELQSLNSSVATNKQDQIEKSIALITSYLNEIKNNNHRISLQQQFNQIVNKIN